MMTPSPLHHTIIVWLCIIFCLAVPAATDDDDWQCRRQRHSNCRHHDHGCCNCYLMHTYSWICKIRSLLDGMGLVAMTRKIQSLKWTHDAIIIFCIRTSILAHLPIHWKSSERIMKMCSPRSYVCDGKH